MLAFEEKENSPAIIKVVGVGGAGMNAVDRMASLNLQCVELIAMNTDEQVLKKSSADTKVHLGSKITRGMGAGAKAEIGAQAAEEDRDKIVNVLKGADMVFITAGMGGGTGTGSSPIVAAVARELHALTVGVVSLPFKAEGQRKMEIARKGQNTLREKVDTLITIPNDAIFKVVERNTPINIAFKALDDVLARSVIGISDIINSTGYVNVDFADVRTVMSQNGDAVIGLGEGEGDNRIAESMQQAIQHPLLEGRTIDGAMAVLINVVGGTDLSLYEYTEIQEKIHDQVSRDAQIIVGFTEDPQKEDTVAITVIATGFRQKSAQEIAEDQHRSKKESADQSQAEKAYNNEGKLHAINGGLQEKRTGTEDARPVQPRENQSSSQEAQQGLNFPNVETNLDNLNIPAFMRKKR